MPKEVKSVKIFTDNGEKEEMLDNVSEFVFSTISEIPVHKLVPNFFDGIIVNMTENRQYIILNEHVGNIAFTKWMHRSRGGIFSKDVNKYCCGKQTGQYFLIDDEYGTSIIRFIEDNEITEFKSIGVIDGKIKDNLYILIKHVKKGENLTFSSKDYNRYIEQILSDDNEQLNEETDEQNNEETYQKELQKNKSLFI